MAIAIHHKHHAMPVPRRMRKCPSRNTRITSRATIAPPPKLYLPLLPCRWASAIMREQHRIAERIIGIAPVGRSVDNPTLHHVLLIYWVVKQHVHFKSEVLRVRYIRKLLANVGTTCCS